VVVKLDTSRLRGRVVKSTTVQTNDPEKPQITLLVEVEVQTSVVILPQEILFLRKKEGAPPVGRVLVRQDEGEDSGTLEVRDVRASVDWLQVSAKPMDVTVSAEGLPPGRKGDWLIEVRFAGAPRYGRSRETVTFRTGLSKQPEVTLAVWVDLSPPVNAPERIVLKPAATGGAEQDLVLSVRAGLDPAGLKADAEPPELTVELEPAGARFYRVHVGWGGGDLASAAVTFTVGDESLRVPVEWQPPPRP
jgi:hypothetical protein